MRYDSNGRILLSSDGRVALEHNAATPLVAMERAAMAEDHYDTMAKNTSDEKLVDILLNRGKYSWMDEALREAVRREAGRRGLQIDGTRKQTMEWSPVMSAPSVGAKVRHRGVNGNLVGTIKSREGNSFVVDWGDGSNTLVGRDELSGSGWQVKMDRGAEQGRQASDVGY